ncbi:MAG: hypothetical protein ACAH12_09710 [Methylophilaceae bacterium]
MKFKTNATILGARQFNDTVEGQRYDFTKVRVLMPVPDGAQNEIGYSQVEMQYGTHDNFAKLENLKFPVQAELEITATSKGYEFNGFTVANQVKAAA